MRASLHTPVEVFVAVVEIVVDAEKLTDGDLEPVSDDEAALDPDTDADSDLLFVTDADSDLLFVFESDSDFEVVADNDGLLESVGSADTEADTLRLPVVLAVVVASMELEAVSDGVKLGETGLLVTEGVNDGDGIIAVYDIKNAEPRDAIFTISAPIWLPLPS